MESNKTGEEKEVNFLDVYIKVCSRILKPIEDLVDAWIERNFKQKVKI